MTIWSRSLISSRSRVVLGDGDVALAHDRAPPAGEPHGGRIGVAAERDDLGGGVPRDGPEHLVLDGGEEGAGLVAVGPVVDGRGVEVADLLVEALLGGPDGPDALEQLVEVVLPGSLGEAGVVHGEALDEVLAQDAGGPLAELDGARRGDAVADGEDHVEVVDLDLTSDPPGALCANH